MPANFPENFLAGCNPVFVAKSVFYTSR